MKKIYLILAVIVCAFSALAMLPGNNSYAAECGDSQTPLGLRPWYAGLVDGNCEIDHSQFEGEEKLQASIWKIVLNVASDILAVVGYLAICFVIWGGYQYMMAQGDPGKVVKGKKTITNALIGLGICMTASIITGAVSDFASDAKENIFITAMNRLFVWSGIIAVIMIVVGGIQYTTSNGNPAQAQKAKQTITYAAIGLAITVFAVAIVNLVVGALAQQ
jgi:cytochrome bd-type quinol oxidase subunit 2